MRIINLALKDLQQLVRDRKALLFLVAMPIMFTAFMGVMLSPPAGPAIRGCRSGSSTKIPAGRWAQSCDRYWNRRKR